MDKHLIGMMMMIYMYVCPPNTGVSEKLMFVNLVYVVKICWKDVKKLLKSVLLGNSIKYMIMFLKNCMS